MKKHSSHSSFSYENTAIMLIWAGIIIIIFITIIYAFQSYFPFLKVNFGEYGELIGGTVGSLWALAGAILFYEALKFQRTELKMQRHEIELQRREIIEQTEQIRKQNETLAIQTIENTYFRLMSLHNEIVETIITEKNEFTYESVKKKQMISGRKCFVEYYQIFKRIFHTSFEDVLPDSFSTESNKMIVEYAFRIFYDEFQADLGHYFRNLFTIFTFIDNADIKNKGFYIKLIRSQLSNYELLMLYFFCLSDRNPSFKPLIEKYTVFRNLPMDELIEITKVLYDEQAFSRPGVDD